MRALLLLAFVAALLAPGCVLQSEQATISFGMQPDSLAAFSTAAPVKCEVHLRDSKEFRQHGKNADGLADFAMLGRVKNIGLTFVHVEWWMTPGVTSYATAALVRANAQRVWGGLELAPGAEIQLDWNKSAGYFDRRTTNGILDVVHGDGVCTLYTIGENSGVGYRFIVQDPMLVLVLDAAN